MNSRQPKHLDFFICLFLTIAAVVCFWQVHSFSFISYDDNQYVYENPHVLNGLTPDGIKWAFTTGHTGYWHPITWLSLMLDSQLFGPKPGSFHLVSVFIHIINALLLFTIMRKMTDALWPSAFVAAAFALHPMHIQSVVWIAERKDVLSTLFWMLTTLAYINFVYHRSWFRYVLTLIFFAFGLMAKPMVATLPFILLLLDYWPLKRFAFAQDKTASRGNRKLSAASSYKTIIFEKIPFLALAALSSALTYLAQQYYGVVVSGGSVTFTSRLANASVSYLTYIAKLFWPQNLAVFYPYNINGYPLWQTALCIFLLFLISVLVIRFAHKCKYLPVGWFWFIGTLLPVIGLIQVGEQAYADRYTYIPYIGLFIILAWGIPDILPKFRLPIFAAALLLLTAMVIYSYQQTSYWQNNFTLFSHAADVTQNNYLACSSLGDEFRQRGDLVSAIEQYKKALKIAPNYANAVLGLGGALAGKGDLNNAILYFEKTLQLKKDPAWQASAHNNIAVALRDQGKFDESIAHFRESILLKPDFAQSRNSFAKVLILKGQFEDAQEQLETAIRLKPNWVEPANTLALLIATHPELKNRDVNKAIDLAERVCQLTNYNNPAALGTLAMAYGAAGQFSKAVEIANKAISLADALNQPRIKEAIEHHLSFYAQGKPYVESAPKQ
jgi:tetratricopeptide (TPR) repeat protein